MILLSPWMVMTRKRGSISTLFIWVRLSSQGTRYHMTTDEHSATVVIQWLRDCRTLKQLARVWGELTPYSQNLPGVEAEKNKRKEMLCRPKKQEKP